MHPEASHAFSTHTVAITQSLEARVQRLEQEFEELHAELKRRFGDQSYSVERSEQLLASIQRLRWAISKAPLSSPLPSVSHTDD